MANNIISDWLETYALYSDTPEQEAATRYAAKLDRLVEAAKEAEKVLTAIDDESKVFSSWATRTLDELTAALRDIKLPSEASSERTQAM